MEFKKLFHTIDDRNNVDYIELNGPFLSSVNTWLGDGYYFWDSFILLAHWWGKVHYNNHYIICETKCSVRDELVFDLYGNLDMITEFTEYKNILQEKYKTKLTVSFVLKHMMKMKNFKYKVIRARGEMSAKSDLNILSQRLKFVDRNDAFLNLCPEIQICFYDKKLFNGNKLKAIYPEYYQSNFTI